MAHVHSFVAGDYIHACSRAKKHHIVAVPSEYSDYEKIGGVNCGPTVIEYRRDDITKNFEYHISVERDDKPPKPKFGGAPRFGRMNTCT